MTLLALSFSWRLTIAIAIGGLGLLYAFFKIIADLSDGNWNTGYGPDSDSNARKAGLGFLFAVIIALIVFFESGCAIVTTDFMPKPVWYWSAEAKQYRVEHQSP